jgi:hypothetical protein
LPDLHPYADWIALLGLLAGVLAAIAGIFAAKYARRAVDQGAQALEQGKAVLTQGEEAQRKAAERYEAAIEPRPRLGTWSPSPLRVGGSNTPDGLSIEVINAGGAAVHTLWIVEYIGALYASSAPLASGAVQRMEFYHRALMVGAGSPKPTPRIVAAEDVHGRWWDCLRRTHIDEDVIIWWSDRARSIGLAMIPLHRTDDGAYSFG